MENAIFTIKYTGAQGFGTASVVFINGELFGTDVVGAEYTGKYQLENGKLVGNANLHVPVGATLVTGGPAATQPYTVPFTFSIPADINEKQTVQVQITLPTGTVNANIKKMKNIAA